MSRQESNRKIIGLLIQRVEECPDERFSQMLYNLGITFSAYNTEGIIGYLVDNYNEESAATLKNIQNRLNRLSDDPSQVEKIP